MHVCRQIVSLWGNTSLGKLEEQACKKASLPKGKKHKELTNGGHMLFAALAGSWMQKLGLWQGSTRRKVRKLEAQLVAMACESVKGDHKGVQSFKKNSRLNDLTFVIASSLNQNEELKIDHLKAVRPRAVPSPCVHVRDGAGAR